MDHLVNLRLLTVFAKEKKMFVTLVDFSQAYDLVPRQVLFKILKRLGCGGLMLATIIAMYRITDSMLGTLIISASVGVRQGSPTSWILFMIYVNDLIKLIKENCEPEGFLSWLHVLVLMHDTVLLATTRANMRRKLDIFLQFCDGY